MNFLYAGPGAKRQRGFSFFEVLVAAMILGIGVLGFAGLQMRALGSTGAAHFRAQAAVLASEMAERVRIIQTASLSVPVGDPGRAVNASSYAAPAIWATTLPTSPPTTWTPRTQTCVFPAIVTVPCTAANIVANDALEMRYVARQLLPQGNIVVTQCGGLNHYCVFVAWNGQAPNACAINDNNANCFGVEVVL